jgi:D-serine deaminase-like pyridoxal phosphate-dependent protein
MKKKQRTSKPKARPVTAAQLDAMHDAGVDLSTHMDLRKAVRPGRQVQRVNVDFPVDLLREIDQEAHRLGVTRQAFIKVRLADALVKTPAS